MNMKYIGLLVLLAFALIQQHAFAQVYRWVDEDGKVHFTDQPPPDQNAEPLELKVTKSNVTGEQLAEDRRKQLESLEASRKELAKARADSAAEKRARKQQCEAARERYDSVVWMKKIHEIDEQGNKTYLSDEDEDRVKQEAKDAVSELCN